MGLKDDFDDVLPSTLFVSVKSPYLRIVFTLFNYSLLLYSE